MATFDTGFDYTDSRIDKILHIFRLGCENDVRKVPYPVFSNSLYTDNHSGTIHN